MRSKMYGLVAAGIVVCLSAAGAHALDPGPKCESSKLGTSAKYAQCRLKADSKSVKTGEAVDYSKCNLGKFTNAEDTAGMGVCPTEGDQTTVSDYLDDCTSRAALWLAGGGGLPDTCDSDLVVCEGDLSTTNADLGTCTGDLGTCNGSLGTCNGNLATCTGSLGTCNSDLSTTNADLSTCTGDLATANAGTAAVGDVLSGKTFTSTAGLGATGTMPNNGAVTLAPTTSDQAIAAGYHDGTGECAGDTDLIAGNIKSGVNLFGVAGELSAGGLLKTGQATCYNSSGTPILCAGTGQDGELQEGVAHNFTENGDGTLTDNVTGLMWEKLSSDGSIHDKAGAYTWSAAISTKVASLNTASFAGYSDWRLPNATELESLRHLGIANPAILSPFNSACVSSCVNTSCSCTSATGYWSSSTYIDFPSNAWAVNFADGNMSPDVKSASHKVRAVRTAS